jgi:hypothetical protein
MSRLKIAFACSRRSWSSSADPGFVSSIDIVVSRSLIGVAMRRL